MLGELLKSICCFFLSLVLILTISVQTVSSCTISILPLRKQFRAAESVFVGKVVKITAPYTPTEQELQLLPKEWKEIYSKNKPLFSKVTFEISDKWKGGVAKQMEFIAVEKYICGCDSKMRAFVIDEEYLVYPEGKNFVTICDAKSNDYEITKNEIKRLDDFWFRS